MKPCPHCNCHIAELERTCPHCETHLSSTSFPRSAAAVALGLAIACGPTEKSPETMPQAVYGAPTYTEETGDTAATDALKEED